MEIETESITRLCSTLTLLAGSSWRVGVGLICGRVLLPFALNWQPMGRGKEAETLQKEPRDVCITIWSDNNIGPQSTERRRVQTHVMWLFFLLLLLLLLLLFFFFVLVSVFLVPSMYPPSHFSPQLARFYTVSSWLLTVLERFTDEFRLFLKPPSAGVRVNSHLHQTFYALPPFFAYQSALLDPLQHFRESSRWASWDCCKLSHITLEILPDPALPTDPSATKRLLAGPLTCLTCYEMLLDIFFPLVSLSFSLSLLGDSRRFFWYSLIFFFISGRGWRRKGKESKKGKGDVFPPPVYTLSCGKDKAKRREAEGQ